ncbi:hypothetical protein TrRE_jg11277 [Triparma retinervis]|uniref:Protein HGH1 homolog n=1 Tax=Triparma retinervis TaxID=2557542 RepID=A0A9W7G6A3_9STRA|nr:hypothetical protein TrRE_jg11277 [Triparma retinervis]
MSGFDFAILSEIVSFLDNSRPDVCVQATSALVASLQVDDGLQVRSNCAHYLENDVPAKLCSLISNPSVSEIEGKAINPEWPMKVLLGAMDALGSMIGEGGEMVGEAACEKGVVGRVGEVIMEYSHGSKKSDTGDKILDSGCRLLANLCRSEVGCTAVLDKEGILAKLINEFESPAADCWDRFQHVATVLMNVTQVERGRKVLLKISDGFLDKVTPSLTANNSIRRMGIAGAIRNVCFEKDSSWWLIHEKKIVDDICYPLCGPEGFDMDDKVGMTPKMWMEGPDKKREPDAETRMLLVEAILLLCATGRKNREKLRELKVYPIVKTLDLSEENEDVSNKIDECVQFLMRDEEGFERVEGEMLAIEPEATSVDVMEPGGIVKPMKPEDWDAVD